MIGLWRIETMAACEHFWNYSEDENKRTCSLCNESQRLLGELPSHLTPPSVDLIAEEQDHGTDWKLVRAYESLTATHDMDRYVAEYVGVGKPGDRYEGREVACGYFYYPSEWMCGYN